MSVKAIGLIVAVLALAASYAGTWFHGQSTGDEQGRASIQKDWDAAKARDAAKTAELRSEGFALASQLETKLTTLEKLYARSQASRRQADALLFACPASGAIGDVVAPAGFIDSMFNRDAGAADAPGAAASEPADAVRPGPSTATTGR